MWGGDTTILSEGNDSQDTATSGKDRDNKATLSEGGGSSDNEEPHARGSAGSLLRSP